MNANQDEAPAAEAVTPSAPPIIVETAGVPPIIPPVIPLAPEPFPGFAQSLALCGIFLAVAAFIQTLLLLTQLPLDFFSGLLVQQLIAWPVTIWVGLKWGGTPLRQACAVKPFSARLLPALFLASFGATILLVETASWIPMPELLRKFLEDKIQSSGAWELFVPVVLVAPVAEELFFRGQILNGYFGRYTVRKAVWGSALLFAVFHLNPWQGVIALPLGLGCAWLVVRTGSVLPGIFSHAVVNFSTNFLAGPLAIALGYSAAELEARKHFPLPVLAIGGLAAGLGLLILKWQLGRRELRLSTDQKAVP